MYIYVIYLFKEEYCLTVLMYMFFQVRECCKGAEECAESDGLLRL